MVNVNSKTFVDIHTTGERKEFGSVREYDKFLKEHKSYVLNKKSIELMQQPKETPKTDYKKLAEKAWTERHKYIKEAKERIAKEAYERRNGKR